MSTIAKFLAQPPNGFSTQIASATVASDALSVTLDSTSGLPTEGIGQFFKKDANGDLIAGSVEFVHWTNVSGSTITFSDTDDRGITGSDSGAQSYVADDYFEVWVSSYYVGGYGGLTEHDADGTHNNATVVTVASNDANLPAAASNIQVNGADPKRGIYVPASAMYPSTTAGCAALAQVESSTNDVNIKVLDFDGAGTSKEYAEFGLPSPLYWDASTVTAQFVWYATAGSGTVNWEMQGLALSDDDALDTAYGTLQEVTDTLTATGDVHVTAATSAITIAGSPVAGDWVQFKVARDPANDTNTSDARLMGVIVRFGIAKYNDA